MKHTQTIIRQCIVLLLMLCLAAPGAFGVVRNMSIVDMQGNSMPNTKVTIVFPDGTEVEEETDDDGFLYYDFPADGEYIVKYPGGQMNVDVFERKGGKGKWIAIGAAAVVAGGVALAAGGGSSSSDDSYSAPSSTSGYSPPSGSSGGGSSGSSPDPVSSPPSYDVSVCNEGVFSVTTSVQSDPGGHAPFGSFDGNWEVFCQGTTQANLTQQSSGAAPPWSCNIGSGGDCDAGPTICSWGGVNTQCSLTSQFTQTGWNGVMMAGVDGALPGGDPVSFSFTGERQ